MSMPMSSGFVTEKTASQDAMNVKVDEFISELILLDKKVSGCP